MARFAFAVFVVSVLAFVVLGVSAKLRYPDADWVEIDLSKLRVNDDVDPGFTDHSPRPGGKDDPDNPNYTRRPILGGTDDPDNPDFSGEHGHGDLDDIPKIPDDAAAPLNCTTIEDLQRHHHHSCGRAFGYATHHCHCDWGECREHKRPHSWCGCPWGKCRQDRPQYCAFIWKYCAHHHHRPGIEPRALKPVMEYGLVTTIQSSPAPTTTAPPAPTSTAPPAPTTTAPPAPTTTAPPAPTTTAPPKPTTTAPPAPTTTAPPKPTTTAPPKPTTTAPPTTAPPTTAPPATTTAHHPSHRCGPWGYTTFACICPMGSCYSRHRPHGYCGCPWGYCKNKRPDFCRYFWKHCPQPHCNVVEPEKPIIDVETSAASIPESTPRPWSTRSTQWPWWQTTENPWWHTTKAPTRVDCGKYGVASDKCKCSWYKCRFWPHRPSGECGCPWGFCREDRPSECKAETPHPHDLRPTDSPRPRPTHGHHHHDKCGRFGVATRDCRCDQGNCRADRPSEECGCPWGQCAQSRPYHCKWRGTEDHHHHHHHHGPPPHHHHHHHHHHRSSESGSSESGSSQSRSSESWEDNGSDESGEVDPNFTEDVEADKMQMILYGAMGFLICSLLFLFMTAMFSIAVKRMRRDTCTGATYRNLTTTPVEYVRNPLENVTKEPEDKEKLIPANE